MLSRSTMFWPSSESKDSLTPASRISSWYFWAFKVPVTTFNCIRWSSDNTPRIIMLQSQFLALKNQCRRFLFVMLSLCSFKGLSFHTSVPNGNVSHSDLFLLCLFIQHTRLRLFHDSTAKKNHSCISTLGQYCVVSFPFMGSRE